MKKENKKDKEIQVPLSILMERATEKVINVINDTQLDIHLKIEVLQNVLKLAINTEQQERLRYESQLKELEVENVDSKTK